MKEEILQKLTDNACNLNDLFDAELDYLLTVSNTTPDAMKGERSHE